MGFTDVSKKLALRSALNQKDAATIATLGGNVAEIFGVLLSAVGPVDKSLEIMNNIKRRYWIFYLIANIVKIKVSRKTVAFNL